MQGLKVGHFTELAKGTGVSVFLLENEAKGAYWICGSAPATHELVVLDPDNSVPEVNALVLSGGSAYGLFSAAGVMQYLTEQGVGHPTPHGIVPIVPAAAIYDLAYKQSLFPLPNDAYAACVAAQENNTQSGQIGAGTGATVGKLIPNAQPMMGGLGRAEINLASGLSVIAYAVVNCVGDVRDAAHQIVAGAKSGGKFADCERYLLSGECEHDLFAHANTTLVAVFTNAAFTKPTLKRIAKMGAAGMARAISPIFTRFDGDIVFCFSLGNIEATELTVGAMAAEAIRLAILDAVKESDVV